jgi:hypothetical protein
MREAKKAVRQIRLSMQSRQILSTLAGVKDVTRRPIRERIEFLCDAGDRTKPDFWTDPMLWGLQKLDMILTLAGGDDSDLFVVPHRYGEPGDQLAITETWRPTWDPASRTAGIEYRADGGERIISDPAIEELVEESWMQGKCERWRPSRFMPVWASRIRRELICVTPERLSQITPEDVLREGIGYGDPENEAAQLTTSWDYFVECWDEIYGQTFPSYRDPWVRRIEFECRKGALP